MDFVRRSVIRNLRTMSGNASRAEHEAQVTPEVAKQIRKIQDRVRELEDQNFLLKERLANSEYVTAQKGEEVNQRDDLLVRLQSELVQDHEDLVKEKEEEIRSLKQQITDLKKESRVPSSKLLNVLWANGREYCCGGCVSDAGNDDSHSELKGGQDNTREQKDDDESTFEYF